ncbi:unnamed protein product [Adineta steineri]|uniref:Uncharacterized protein n=1 Tax=Adineta steineri TaxID=433720 RepID=A0A819BKI0_9BILA|nr:unnamed protein product [Adineta steineri]CAF3795738.1 unnamed protein product [Adineta steineri]
MASNDYQRYVSSKQRKRRIIRCIIYIVITTILITLAVITPNYLEKLIKGKLSAKTILQPDSDGFASWLDPPIHTVRSYYLFNVTNPDEIVTNPSTTKIHVQDTPPYTYNIKTKKNNVTWSNNNKKLDYEVERLFTRDKTQFNPSSVNDTGVFIDLLRAIFRTTFERKPDPNFYLLGGKNTFRHGNAVEQLEGFTSDLFKIVRDKMKGPNTDKSGFIYRNNGSRLYNISIKTDLAEKGQVNTFDNELVDFTISSPSHYPFPVYDGLTYPPNLFDKPILNIFNSDFCAPVLLQFNNVTKMFGNILVHEYKIKLIDINNCINSNDTSTCTEVDKLDVSKCISSSLPDETIFLSKAHFYGSNNETIEKMNIQGFKPSSDKHDSTVYFEPYTGTPLEASFRMQLNIDATIDPMRKSENGLDLEPKNSRGVKRLVPVFWLDQDIKLAQSMIIKLQISMFILKHKLYVLIGLALILSIVIIGITECLVKRADKKARSKRGGYVNADTLIHH